MPAPRSRRLLWAAVLAAVGYSGWGAFRSQYQADLDRTHQLLAEQAAVRRRLADTPPDRPDAAGLRARVRRIDGEVAALIRRNPDRAVERTPVLTEP